METNIHTSIVSLEIYNVTSESEVTRLESEDDDEENREVNQVENEFSVGTVVHIDGIKYIQIDD